MGNESKIKNIHYFGVINVFIILGIFLIYFLTLYKTLTNGFGSSFDDAYMFFRYARNLISSQQLSWNLGENPIYGPTSIPYVYVVAIFTQLIPSLKSNFLLPFVSWLIGVFTISLLLVITWAQTKKSTPIISTFALGCTAWAVTTPFFMYHATTGMDTTLSISINTLLVFAGIKTAEKHTPGNIFFLIFSAYLSYAIRPDNIIYAVGFPLLILLILKPSPLWREALLFITGFVLFMAMDAVIKMQVFQEFFPLSYYVKQNNFYQGYLGAYQWNPSIYLATFIIGILPSSITLLTNFKSKYIRLTIAYLLPVLATFLYYFKVLQIMGEYARYYYPAMPFIVILGVLILRDIDKPLVGVELNKSFKQILYSSLSITIFLLFLGTIGSNIYLSSVPPKPDTQNNSLIPKIGWGSAIVSLSSLSNQLPPNTVLAASEVGYIGASAPQVKIIDLVGLNNSEIAHHGLKAEKLFLQKPDLIWLPPVDYPAIRREIECNSDFFVNYTYYPGLFDFGIAINKKSAYKNSIDTLLSKEIEIAYPNLGYALHDLEQDSPSQYCK